ncbi:MAG: helix-turn-helix transcriptional regulator [Balneolaceae bacterium]
MSKVKICLVGDSILINEAFEHFLTGKGFKTYSNSLKYFFEDNQVYVIDPDILIFEEHILYTLGQAVFELWSNVNKEFRRVFILNDRSVQFLGMGLIHGIEGFVHERGGLEELETCLVNVLKHVTYISPFLAGPKNLNGKSEHKAIPKDIHLTNREIKILKLVKQRKTSKEIGAILRTSYKTVQNHRQNNCNKLGLKGHKMLYEFSKLYFD